MRRSFFLVFSVLIGLLASLMAERAQALTVTVGGVTYELQQLTVGQSFNDNSVALTDPAQTAWFNNPDLAFDIRDAVFATEGPRAYTRVFAHTAPVPAGDPFVRSHAVFGTDTTIPQLANRSDSLGVSPGDVAFFGASLAYYTGAVAVPEINGSMLAQVLLILSALYFFLIGRRRVT